MDRINSSVFILANSSLSEDKQPKLLSTFNKIADKGLNWMLTNMLVIEQNIHLALKCNICFNCPISLPQIRSIPWKGSHHRSSDLSEHLTIFFGQHTKYEGGPRASLWHPACAQRTCECFLSGWLPYGHHHQHKHLALDNIHFLSGLSVRARVLGQFDQHNDPNPEKWVSHFSMFELWALAYWQSQNEDNLF